MARGGLISLEVEAMGGGIFVVMKNMLKQTKIRSENSCSNQHDQANDSPRGGKSLVRYFSRTILVGPRRRNTNAHKTIWVVVSFPNRCAMQRVIMEAAGAALSFLL